MQQTPLRVQVLGSSGFRKRPVFSGGKPETVNVNYYELIFVPYFKGDFVKDFVLGGSAN